MEITIVRVGTGENDLSLKAASALKSAEKIVLHTAHCGCAKWLNENNIPFDTLDDIYDEAYDFDEVADEAVKRLNAYQENVHFCVMELQDETVKRLLDADNKISIIASGADDLLIARAKGAYLTVCAIDIENTAISKEHDTIVKEIDTRELASEVKLKLMHDYPDESDIYVLQRGGVAKCSLTDLDRLSVYDHTVSCLIHANTSLVTGEKHDFYSLMRLTRALRDPDTGCPWDREQTHETLKRDTLEEAYELEDAIENGDENDLIEELGDVLFTAALQIQVAIDHGEFDEIDVITGVVNKMVSRHSHVFGRDEVENIDGLMNLWDKAKRKEKALGGVKDEMNAVAKAFPALLRAQKVLKRAQKAGYQTLDINHLAINEQNIGNALFEIAEWARQRGIDAEKALQDTILKYIDEFNDQ
ncbi:MAG: hypothetical protein IJC48_00120 [Clostridia bacterium]|nr:hypothetical protein [Clostridia bacterium]MBQ4156849.1 hypothetical protein [Clostridia bacterium]